MQYGTIRFMNFAAVPAFLTTDFDLANAGLLFAAYGRRGTGSRVRQVGQSRRRTGTRVFLVRGEDIKTRRRVVLKSRHGAASGVALYGSDRA